MCAAKVTQTYHEPFVKRLAENERELAETNDFTTKLQTNELGINGNSLHNAHHIEQRFLLGTRAKLGTPLFPYILAIL
jgi:hypothetical protein